MFSSILCITALIVKPILFIKIINTNSFNICYYQGGSLKKDTAIRGKADLDLVVFLNEFKDISEFKHKLPAILKILEEYVISSGILAEVKARTEHALIIRLRSKVCGDDFDVDILPAPAFNNIQNAGIRFVNSVLCFFMFAICCRPSVCRLSVCRL